MRYAISHTHVCKDKNGIKWVIVSSLISYREKNQWKQHSSSPDSLLLFSSFPFTVPALLTSSSPLLSLEAFHRWTENSNTGKQQLDRLWMNGEIWQAWLWRQSTADQLLRRSNNRAADEQRVNVPDIFQCGHRREPPNPGELQQRCGGYGHSNQPCRTWTSGRQTHVNISTVRWVSFNNLAKRAGRFHEANN